MKTVSVTEARALQEQGYTYVDVRSTPEFAAGHPAGAVNVPIIEPDEDTGQMQMNPDFLRVMQANFPRDAKLLLGCQVGGRSARAVQMLGASGFVDVSNVRGGFGGAYDQMSGRAIDAGWVDEDLPVEDGDPAGRAYRDLVAKADRDR
jgi:rhodanese-related sulfurtransferase